MSVDEKREFFRVDHETLLKYKIMAGDKLVDKPDVLSQNISPCGLLFRTEGENTIPPIGCIIWVELDDKMLNICEEIENDLLIHENGIYGRVVRIAEGDPGATFDIGVCFLRRQNMDGSEIEPLVG